MNEITEFKYDLLHKSITNIDALAKQCALIKSYGMNATGEVRNAYDRIYADLLWQIQQRCWELAHYMAHGREYEQVLSRRLGEN
jgi:hypothetical protein